MKTIRNLLLMATLQVAFALSASYVQAATEVPEQLKWTREPWNGSDLPFLKIKKSIDTLAKNNTNIERKLDVYRREAYRKETSAEAQFKWGYISYIAASKQHKIKEIQRRTLGPARAMGKPKFPNSYEYARLRYLLSARYGEWSDNIYIVQCGKRLLKRKPGDLKVKYYIAYDLIKYGDKNERQVTALQYAK